MKIITALFAYLEVNLDTVNQEEDDHDKHEDRVTAIKHVREEFLRIREGSVSFIDVCFQGQQRPVFTFSFLNVKRSKVGREKHTVIAVSKYGPLLEGKDFQTGS